MTKEEKKIVIPALIILVILLFLTPFAIVKYYLSKIDLETGSPKTGQYR